ncbi:MAG: DUF6694 family lipoprotein [Gammaproteobacteria bacterium]
MKIDSIIIIVICAGVLIGCGQSDKINASSESSLYRSVVGIQRSLPAKRQVEYQVSFWSLKQFAENESEFRKLVHRKSVEEIIELGKENFARQNEVGNPEFTKYASWDDMISNLLEERKQSELRPRKEDVRDQSNRIHNM